MGNELASWDEWQHERGLDWHLLNYDRHEAVRKLVEDLNHLYAREPALHELDCEPEGFEWVDGNDYDNSALTFLRKGRDSEDVVLIACNFTPVPRPGYRIGVPRPGRWQELLNSDANLYWGSSPNELRVFEASEAGAHGRPYSLELELPPLGAVFLKWQRDEAEA
jgi:1,4-alpha-glucan branching enzyme